MSADSTDSAPLPDHLEDRLAEFTELVATAISNTASRDELARLADEQAALRRVATLVARGLPRRGVRGRRARGRPAPRCRRHAHGALRGGRRGTTVASWSGSANRLPVGIRIELGNDDPELDHAQTPTPSAASWAPLIGGARSSSTDALGSHDRARWRRGAPGGYGFADRRLHGARRDRDLEHRGAHGGQAAGGRAGGVAARRDARRAGRAPG